MPPIRREDRESQWGERKSDEEHQETVPPAILSDIESQGMILAYYDDLIEKIEEEIEGHRAALRRLKDAYTP